jgi:mannose-6-phosphate isomerase-like protein (cupin superfamily)
MTNPEITAKVVSISKETADHYVWGGQCDGWHLLKNSELSVIQERMPPGTAEVPHFHQRAQQFFYVLAGEARMDVDGRSFELTAGEGIWIPTGVVHQMRNDSSKEVHFLVISQPPSHGDRQAAPENAAPNLV